MDGDLVDAVIESKTEQKSRHDRPHTGLHDGNSREQCDGCRDLTSRVERLERQLENFVANPIVQTQFSTTACYWLIIGIHGFAMLMMLTGIGAMLAYPFLLGALGTLAACHVLPLRNVAMKWARTALSTFIVMLCAMLPLGMLSADLGEFLPLLLVGLPIVIPPALLGSQLFVWIGGWRILPPGMKSNDSTRFRIMDIFGITVLAAVFAALFRYADFDEFDVGFEDGSWIYLLGLVLLCLLMGVTGSVTARSLLNPGSRVSKRWLLFATLIFGLSFSAILIGYMLLTDSLDLSDTDVSELAITFGLYGIGGTIVSLLSPILSFFLMRMAGYRIRVPTKNRTINAEVTAS